MALNNDLLIELAYKTSSMYLTGVEHKMLFIIALNYNDSEVCELTDAQLSKFTHTGEKKVSNLLTRMVGKDLIKIQFSKDWKRRFISIPILNAKKYINEPKFEEMSRDQQKFKLAFPDRKVDCDVPDHVDIDALIKEMKKSEWILSIGTNMHLKSCCFKNFNKIMTGGFLFQKPEFDENDLFVRKNQISSEIRNLNEDELLILEGVLDKIRESKQNLEIMEEEWNI